MISVNFYKKKWKNNFLNNTSSSSIPIKAFDLLENPYVYFLKQQDDYLHAIMQL